MDFPCSCIYQIRNLVNGKIYVGSATVVEKRLAAHKRMLVRGKHHSVKLQRSWDKHGESVFDFRVVEGVADEQMLLQREQVWLDITNAAIDGYNISKTAGSLLGFKHSQETKKRMSDAKKGVKKSPEHVAKYAEAMRGRKMTDEQKQKMRDAKIGKKRMPHSAETKAKMSASKKGIKPSELSRAKMSASAKARKRNPKYQQPIQPA